MTAGFELKHGAEMGGATGVTVVIYKTWAVVKLAFLHVAVDKIIETAELAFIGGVMGALGGLAITIVMKLFRLIYRWIKK
jgi:hypothetical protein